jgi:hypothetical protein
VSRRESWPPSPAWRSGAAAEYFALVEIVAEVKAAGTQYRIPRSAGDINPDSCHCLWALFGVSRPGDGHMTASRGGAGPGAGSTSWASASGSERAVGEGWNA